MALNPRTTLGITITGTHVPGPAAEPWWSDDNGVGGANANGVKSSLALAGLAAGNLDSVVQAIGVGPYGNDITVAAAGDSPAAGGVSIVVSDKSVVIHFESGVSTVANVETAIAALAGSAHVIAVKTAGTGATVLHAPGDNFTATHLAGGVNPGHEIGGFHVDEAFIELTVSNWGSVAKLEILADVSGDQSGNSPWVTSAPVSPVVLYPSAYLDYTGGRLYVLASTVATKPIRIPLNVTAAQRFRVGVRGADHANDAAFACTVKVGFIQRSVQL